MKRKYVLSIILFLFVVILVISTFILCFPDFFLNQKKSENEEELQVLTREYRVYKGEITHTHEIDGCVVSDMPELYTLDFEVKNITNDTFKLHKNLYDDFAKDDVLYSYKGKDFKADFNGKVVDVIYNTQKNQKDVSLKVLNYDKLYITAKIDEKMLKRINYQTSVNILIGNDSYEEKIKTIGYEVINNNIELQVTAPVGVLPGTSVKVSLILDTDSVGLYVPITALYHNGNNYYAFVKREEELEQVEIATGQEFSIEEDGNVFKYIEITDGVKEGDILIVEESENYLDKLNEELNNE